jgi:hypothetical protein
VTPGTDRGQDLLVLPEVRFLFSLASGCAAIAAVSEPSFPRWPNTSVRFSQRISREHLVLELHRDECGEGDLADFPGPAVTCCRICQSWVSSAKPRSPRHRAERRSTFGVRILIVEFFHPCGFLHRDVDAVTCAFVAGIGEGGHRGQEGRTSARTFSRGASRGAA